MEWYYYALGIFTGGLGLLVVYIILRRQNIIGSIPIFSGIVDPLLYGHIRGAQGWYDEPRGRTNYWKPDATIDDIEKSLYEDGYPERVWKDIGSAFEKQYNTDIENVEIIGEGMEGFSDPNNLTYDPKTGVITEKLHYRITDVNNDESMTGTLTVNLKTGKTKIEETSR